MLTAKQLQNAILITVSMLLCIGLVMVYSTSAMVAQLDPNTATSYFFIKKQIIWVLLAGAAMLACMEIPYAFFRKYGYHIFCICIFLLILVLIPGIGKKYNGARRWIRVAGMGFQPSDFMKLAAIIFIATYVDKNLIYLKHFYAGFLPVFAGVGFAGLLILMEPDFGTCCFVMLISTLLLLIAGIRFRHLIPLFLAALPVIILLAIFKFHHIQARISTYLNPDNDPWGKGYQIRQALIALGSGGKFGMGLGRSKQKLFFLSEESTDFIFAVIGEELGLLGTASIIILYLLFVYYGFQVVKRAPDIFSMILSCGIVLAVSFQSIFNIAVVTHTIPSKGISLPLISFGGSGLLLYMMAIGILVNIAGHCKAPSEIPRTS